MSECTLFRARAERRNYITVNVYFEKALFIYDFSAGFLHERRKGRIGVLYFCNFFLFQRGTAVAR